MHAAHPDIREHGLADNCPACAAAARDPWAALDRAALTDLLDRTLRNRFGTTTGGGRFGEVVAPRSDAEAVAMGRLLTALERLGMIAGVAPDKLALYLAVRWRVTLPAVEPA